MKITIEATPAEVAEMMRKATIIDMPIADKSDFYPLAGIKIGDTKCKKKK